MHHSLRQTLGLLIAGSSLLFGFAQAEESTDPTSLEIRSTTEDATTAAPDTTTTAAEPRIATSPEAGEPAGAEPTPGGATEVLKTKTRSNQSND